MAARRAGVNGMKKLTAIAIVVASVWASAPASADPGYVAHWRVVLHQHRHRTVIVAKIDSTAPGETWRFRVRQDGRAIDTGRVDSDADGDLTFRSVATNEGARDVFVLQARNLDRRHAAFHRRLVRG